MINPWAYLLVVNLLTYAMYWQDKRAARARRWRVSEYMLLLAGFMGGSPGAFIAQQLLRHKNRKRRFQFQFWALVIVQLLLLAFPPAILQQLLARVFA